MIFGKVYNARWSVERTKRDHAMRVDTGRLAEVSAQLQGLLPQIAAETSLESLRGLEAVSYTHLGNLSIACPRAMRKGESTAVSKTSAPSAARRHNLV